MKKDPRVRKDGLCAEPSCRKPRRITKQSRKYAGDAVVLDPFCSTECCRKWHGVELETKGAEAQREAGRASAARFRAERGWDEEDEAA